MPDAHPPVGEPPPPCPESPPVPRPPASGRVARWWGGYVSLGMLGLSILLVIATVVAAAMSEQRGVTMAYAAIGPFAFGVAGTIVALITRHHPNRTVAVGAPLGCGCLAWVVGFLLLFVFMVGIFPKL